MEHKTIGYWDLDKFVKEHSKGIEGMQQDLKWTFSKDKEDYDGG